MRACSDRLLTLGREHGLEQYQAIGGIFHGWALTQSASGEEGLAELRSCVGFYAEIGWTMSGLFRAILTEAELRAGNFEQAVADLLEAAETPITPRTRRSCGTLT